MEEEKAAAYYDELTRKGEGAAKFKQGLGFSSSSSDPFAKKTSPFSLSSFVRASDSNYSGDKPTSSASLSSFVRASSPKRDDRAGDRTRVLDSIHDKLNRGGGGRRRSPGEEREKRRERSGERGREDEERHSSRRSRDGDGDRERSRRRKSRSRSYSPSRVSHSRDRDRDRHRGREKDRSSKDRRSGESKSERAVDYERLIEGYSSMTPAERVKAKMKLQLSQTAAKDTTIGMSSGWERFDFNKEAPLDDDEDATEVAADDVSIKNIGKSFRFSAVEAKREEEVKAAHDQAMFGGGMASAPVNLTTETVRSPEESEEDADDAAVGNNMDSLISDKVLSMQQGSWRDRARRLQNGPGKS